MSDEGHARQSVAKTSSLVSRVNAAPFVPANTAKEPKLGSSTNVNAKPFTPGPPRVIASPKRLGVEAKPFVPSPNGESSAKGISANANAFVPSSSSGGRPSESGAAAINGLPVVMIGGRTPRNNQGRPSYTDDFAARPGLVTFDDRGNYGLPGPIPLPTPRVSPNPYTSSAYSSRATGAQSPSSRPATPPLATARGGRFPGAPIPGGRGLGRGRGGLPQLQHGSSAAGMGALGRAQQIAALTVDQLVPQLQMQSSISLMQMPSEMQAEVGYPDMLQHFHSLYPLEDSRSASERPSKAFGVQSEVLKGVSMHDGTAFAIRKFGWRQVPPSPELLLHANEVVEAWAVLGLHPNLSVPRLAFVSMDIGGRASLYMTHELYATAFTLEAAHLQPQVSVSEDAAWNYLLQLAAALRAVHSMGLACRAALAPSKVLLLPGTRLRVGSIGVAEVLGGKAARQDDVAALQGDDLLALGQLMLQLLCGTAHHPSIEHCAAYFSPELTHIVASLLGQSQTPFTSWHQLTSALRDYSSVDLDAKHLYLDALTSQLGQELENGRLLRLLIKLSTVTERADTDTQWAETGDRYLLKLFRDFVFHQCTEEGAPILDWAHVTEALNKLDAGLPEKIVLLSRDEASMLVVSYADIRKCMESTYGDLRRAALTGLKRG